MLLNGEIFEQNVELLAETDVLLHKIHILSDFQAIHNSFATCWFKHACKHIKQSCLSRTVVAEDGEDFFLFD